jgi:hypothetical protein
LPYFEDAQEVYDHLGRLIADLTEDEELGPRLRRANTILRHEYTEPPATITVRLREGEPGDVDFGESTMEPEVTMAMPADIAHRFWLGEVDVAAALTRGQIEARGPVDKILELVPLARPVVPRYRRQLIAQGREDLTRM